MKKSPVIAAMIATAFFIISSTHQVAQAQHQTNGVTVTNTYAAKFICGVQQDANITSMPDAQAGRYSTKINVHNNTGVVINYRKKIIWLREAAQKATDPIKLPPSSLKPDQAMEIVCKNIYNYLNIPLPLNQVPRYIEGFVILEVFFPSAASNAAQDPLDVEGIYTYKGDIGAAGGSGVSIDVVVYPAKSNKHPLQ